MIRAAAQHARAPPHEFASGSVGVRLAGHLPAAHQRGIVIAERLRLRARGAMRSIVVPLEHVALLGGIVIAARFEHADLGAGQREHVRGNAAARSRAHHHDVVALRTGFDLRHGPPWHELIHFTGPKAKRAKPRGDRCGRVDVGSGERRDCPVRPRLRQDVNYRPLATRNLQRSTTRQE